MATDYNLNIIATLDTKNVDQQINRLNQSLKTINLGQNGQTVVPQSPVIPTNAQQTSLGNLGALNGTFARLTSTLDRLTAEVQRLNTTLLKPSEDSNTNIGTSATVVASSIFQKNIPNWTQQVQQQNMMLDNILRKYSVNFEDEWRQQQQQNGTFTQKIGFNSSPTDTATFTTNRQSLNEYIQKRLDEFRTDMGVTTESVKKLGKELANVSKETDKTNASFKTMRTALGFLGGSYVVGAILNSYETIQAANDPIGAKYNSLSHYGRGVQSGLLGMALGGTAGAAVGAKIGTIGGPWGMGIGAALGFGSGFVNSLLPWWLGAGVNYQTEEYSKQFAISKTNAESMLLGKIHESGSDVLNANWNNWDDVELAKEKFRRSISKYGSRIHGIDEKDFNLDYEKLLNNLKTEISTKRFYIDERLEQYKKQRTELNSRAEYIMDDDLASKRENLEQIEKTDKRIKELTASLAALDTELNAVKSLENQRKYILQREREREIAEEVQMGQNLSAMEERFREELERDKEIELNAEIQRGANQQYMEEDFANLERSQRYFIRDENIRKHRLRWYNEDVDLLESKAVPSFILNRLNEYSKIASPYMEKKTSLEEDLSNAETFTEWSSIKEEYDRNQQQLDWFQNRMTSLGDAYTQKIANAFVNFDSTTKGNEISKLAAIGGFGRENTHADRDLVIKVSDIVDLLKESNGVGKQIRDMFENNTQGVVFQ